MKPTFLPTLIPFTKEAQAVLALSPDSYDGYWARKDPWISSTGEVFDQRLSLGTPRPPEPRRCLEWNGSSQYAWIPVDPVTAFPFTLFGWYNANAPADAYLCGISATGNTGERFSISPQRNTVFARAVAAGSVADFTIPNHSGTWKSIVVSFNSSTSISMWIDGLFIGTQTISAVSVGSTYVRFTVGSIRFATPSNFFNGRSMHCGFLRRAATLQDAQTFHATGEIPDAEVLLPLDGNSTTVAHNIGSSAAQWLDEPRRNFLTYTEDFSNSAWQVFSGAAKTGTAVVTNPDGGTDGVYEIAFGATGGALNVASALFQNLPVTAGASNTFSVWVRTVTGTSSVRLAIFPGSPGTLAGTNDVAINTTWQRLTFTINQAFASGGGGPNAEIRNNTAGTTGSIYIWHPQLELGSTATTYQPVLRTGINYPEATIVNGAAGMLYTGRDVPFSRQNEIGFSTRKNLLANTDTGIWIGVNSPTVLSTSAINPFGVANASRLETTVTSLSGGRSDSISSIPAATRISMSCWIKNETYTGTFRLRFQSTSFGAAREVVFNMNTGEIISAWGTISDILSENYGNGWFRFTASILTEQLGNAEMRFAVSGGTGIWQGFGQQTEYGRPTPYQRIGADPGSAVRFPALLSDPTKSAATDPLTFSGEAPFNGQLQEANCFTLDGSDDRVAMNLADIAGPELVTNGTFDTDLSNWLYAGDAGSSGSAVWSGGKARIERNAGRVGIRSLLINVIAGRQYLLTASAVSISGSARANFNLRTSSTNPLGGGEEFAIANSTLGQNLTVNQVWTSTVTGERWLWLNVQDGNGVYEWDNISIRELPSTIRPNVVENGTFGSSASWTLGTGWTIGSGVATKTAGTASVLSQTEPFVIGRKYLLTYTLTRSAGTITPRFTGGTTVNGTARSAGGTFSEILTTLAGNTTLEFSADSAFAGTVDNVTLQEIVEIQNDGTSILTYRSQGDGFTGTAGTAFNIRFGDVEHIPCSEGAGDKLHGTRLNQEYLIVNGQASNWTTKQNTYHYNTVFGFTESSGINIPASQTNPGFDVLGNALTNPPVVGLNGAESKLNFSPVANSWPTGVSIPGADIPVYDFNGNPGDIDLGINTSKREASFHLRND